MRVVLRNVLLIHVARQWQASRNVSQSSLRLSRTVWRLLQSKTSSSALCT